MKPSEKIADYIVDRIPESVTEFIKDHPAALYAVTAPLVIWGTVNLYRMYELHMAVGHLVHTRAAEAARIASEGLGG